MLFDILPPPILCFNYATWASVGYPGMVFSIHNSYRL